MRIKTVISDLSVNSVLVWLLILLVSTLKARSQDIADVGFKNHTTYWRVHSSSSLKISGSTNINHFDCLLESPQINDTLSFSPDYIKTRLEFNQKKVKIDVREFECDNSMMTHDFRKTLKVDKFPFIHLLFLNIEISPELSPDTVPGKIKLVLAGTSKEYQIEYDISELGPDQWVLKGAKTISLKDFNLNPPSRLFNLIKVNDSINIFFNLHLQLMDI